MLRLNVFPKTICARYLTNVSYRRSFVTFSRVGRPFVDTNIRQTAVNRLTSNNLPKQKLVNRIALQTRKVIVARNLSIMLPDSMKTTLYVYVWYKGIIEIVSAKNSEYNDSEFWFRIDVTSIGYDVAKKRIYKLFDAEIENKTYLHFYVLSKDNNCYAVSRWPPSKKYTDLFIKNIFENECAAIIDCREFTSQYSTYYSENQSKIIADESYNKYKSYLSSRYDEMPPPESSNDFIYYEKLRIAVVGEMELNEDMILITDIKAFYAKWNFALAEIEAFNALMQYLDSRCNKLPPLRHISPEEHKKYKDMFYTMHDEYRKNNRWRY